MGNVQISEQTALAQTTALTPNDLLTQAVAKGDVELVEKLLTLQERWEKNQARKAFGRAIAAAKLELKPVIKKRQGHNGKYEDMAAIADSVDPIISKHGLYYRYRSAQDDKKISVTCILEHDDGHCEETTLSGPPDTSGNKNAIQAIGSTATYLERYTLKLALGLAAAVDDDGRAAGDRPLIDADQAKTLRDNLKAVGASEARFIKWANVEKIEDIYADLFDSCLASIANFKPAKAAS